MAQMVAVVAVALIAGYALDHILSEPPEEVIKVSTNIINKNITNLLQKHSVKASTVVDLKQGFSLKIIRSRVYCPSGEIPPLTQKIIADINIVTKVTNELVTDVKNLIDNSVKQSIEQSSKQVQELLAPAIKGKTITDVITDIQNIIENNITLESLTEIFNKTALTQDQELEIIDSDFEFCGIDQDMTLKLSSKQIVDNLSTAIINNTIIQDISKDIKQYVDRESTGLQSLISSLTLPFLIIAGIIIFTGGKALTNKWFWLGLTLLIVVLAIIYYLTKSSEESKTGDELQSYIKSVAFNYPDIDNNKLHDQSALLSSKILLYAECKTLEESKKCVDFVPYMCSSSGITDFCNVTKNAELCNQDGTPKYPSGAPSVYGFSCDLIK